MQRILDGADEKERDVDGAGARVLG